MTQAKPQFEQFDIRNFTDSLTPKKGKNRYHCPFCNDGSLTIEPKTGKYQCWAGCAIADIREAVSPWKGLERTSSYVPAPRKVKPKPTTPAPIPAGDIELGRLPQPVKAPARMRVGRNIQVRYPYSPTRWVLRTEYPDGKKSTLPYHVDAKGDVINSTGGEAWPAYRMNEILRYGIDKYALAVEGEKCADAARAALQLLTLTWQGSKWEAALMPTMQAFKDAGIRGIIYYPDHDKAGYTKAQKCFEAAAKAGLPFITINPLRLWPQCPDKGDIADWLQTEKLTQQEFIERLQQEVNISKDEARPDLNTYCPISNTQYPLPNTLDSLPVAQNPLPVTSDSTLDDQKEIEPEQVLIDWAWQQWLQSRKFTPDITVSQESFSLPKIPNSDAIIAIKSGLGTGKTSEIIREILRANRGALIIGYLNNLLFQTISRAAEQGAVIYHLREDDGHSLIADDSTHQAFCLDSISHVDGYFHGRDIYLDETCSVLLHAITGGTLKDKQAKAIKLLSHALNVCNRVFLLDGNLADLVVSLVAKLAPNKKVIKIENQKKIPPHNIRFIEGIDAEGELKKRDKSAIVSELCAEGNIPCVGTDSKELSKVLDKLLRQSGKHGYCINSESVGEDWAKKFLDNPDDFIKENKPGYIIFSPSCGSGVSITTRDYFTSKFSFFCGVKGTDAQTQIMFRLRDDSIPHYVFCPAKSMVQDRASPKTYNVKVYAESINQSVLQSATFAAEDSGCFEEASKLISAALSRNDKNWCDYSYRLGVLDNFEMDNLRKCLIHALKESGHNVEVIQWNIDKDFQDNLKQAKTEVQQEYSTELYDSVEFESLLEAEKVARGNQRKDTQRRVEKTRLLDRLPGIKNTEVWSVDFILNCYIKDRDYINKQQRFWLLNNFDVCRKRHEVNWYYLATSEDVFTGRAKRPSRSYIWALREINLPQFFTGEWHKNSPEVLAVIDRVRNDKEVSTALGKQPGAITQTGQERITFIAELLDSVGVPFKFQGQERIDGIRQRIYAVDDEAIQNPYRLEVLAAVERKLSQWMLDRKEVSWMPSPPTTTESNSHESTVLVHEAMVNSHQSEPLADDDGWLQSETISLEVQRAIATLKAATSWGQVGGIAQDLLDKAWPLLSSEDDVRLRQLFEFWQQSQISQPRQVTCFGFKDVRFLLLELLDNKRAKIQSLMTNEILVRMCDELRYAN